MIADRHPFVVGQQRLVGAKQPSDRASRDESRYRSRCSRRCAPAAQYCAWRCGTQAGCKSRCCARARAQQRATARSRSADQARRAGRHELVQPAGRHRRRRALAARCASDGPARRHPAFDAPPPDRGSGRRSRRRRETARSLPARRNTPSGRFWSGKSGSGALADATQLRRRGSCVSLMPWRSSRRLSAAADRSACGRPCQHSRVIALQLRRLERVARRADHAARLEHERHGVGDVLGLRGIGATARSRTWPHPGRARSCSCAARRRPAGSPPPWHRRRPRSAP